MQENGQKNTPKKIKIINLRMQIDIKYFTMNDLFYFLILLYVVYIDKI
jgi:hypothetical protein